MSAEYSSHEIAYTANGEKKLYYLSTGPVSGPLLIFLHGWPGIASTWKPQLATFAALGFRTVAPDMPGYGNSTSNRVHEDYSHENIIVGLLALLKDTGRDQAVWIGHDWGAGVLCSLAATQPQVCRAICLLSVPYGVVEYGLEEIVKTVNRELYPVEQYPYGQWEYMAFYEQQFEKATTAFDWDIEGTLIYLLTNKGDDNGDHGGDSVVSAGEERRAHTATTLQRGGWFDGAPGVSPEVHQTPVDKIVLRQDLFAELVAAMKKTGFFGADSYYMNHARNRDYNLKNRVNDGVLQFPVLFVDGSRDRICSVRNNRFGEPMRNLCTHLTELTIDSGHDIQWECPEQVNVALVRWLAKEVKDWWP